jgi:protein TonB
MFEQATLTNGPAGKRVWTTFLGLTSQVAMVSFAVLAPMVWPQVLPTMRFWESLAPPVPPGPKPLGDTARKPPARAMRVWREAPLWRYEPASIPRDIAMLQEEPAEIAVVGAPVGAGGGAETGVMGAVLAEMTRHPVHVMPPAVVEMPVATAPAGAPAAIQRLTQGGRVQLGQALRKAPPQYPAAAKAARVSGDVVLECVVGTDGRILEVKVKRGNPLLVRAAVDAVWQWAYEPSQLNGVPIEIVTNITVSFKLN